MKTIQVKKTLDVGDGIGYLSETITDKARVLITDKTLHDKYTGKLIRKIGVSVSSGCGIGCIYCFTNDYSAYRPLSWKEIVDEVNIVFTQSKIKAQHFDEVKVSFKQMGDPMLNQGAIFKAIRFLINQHPDFHFVVSTSGPRLNSGFFQDFEDLTLKANVRLQFSCHTTSDKERNYLSPKLPMMTFREIADTVANWKGSIVTLNFVMIKGYTYDVAKLKELFNPSKVFIKINHLDHNDLTKKNSLQDMEGSRVNAFIDNLQKAGFQYAHRH